VGALSVSKNLQTKEKVFDQHIKMCHQKRTMLQRNKDKKTAFLGAVFQ
jgi:hypothetical protein